MANITYENSTDADNHDYVVCILPFDISAKVVLSIVAMVSNTFIIFGHIKGNTFNRASSEMFILYLAIFDFIVGFSLFHDTVLRIILRTYFKQSKMKLINESTMTSFFNSLRFQNNLQYKTCGMSQCIGLLQIRKRHRKRLRNFIKLHGDNFTM